MNHPHLFIDPFSGKPWVAWFASGTPAEFKTQWETEGGKIALSVKDANITHFFSMKKHEKKIRRLLDTNQTILYHPSWIKDSISVQFAKPLGHYVLEDHSFVEEEAGKKPRTKSNYFPRFRSRSPEIVLSRAGELGTTVQRNSPRTPPNGTSIYRLGDLQTGLRIEEEAFIVVPFSTSPARSIERTPIGGIDDSNFRHLNVNNSPLDASVKNVLDRNTRATTSPSALESCSAILRQPSKFLPDTVQEMRRARRKLKRKVNDDDFFEPPPAEMIDIEDDFFAKTGTYSGDALLERAIDLSARLLEGDTRYRAVMKKPAT